MKLEVEGIEPLIERLRDIGPKFAKRELKKAVRAASQIVLRKARMLAPRGDGLNNQGKVTTSLRKSLDKKIKQYQSTATGIIGSRYRIAPHDILVHEGTGPHDILLPAGKGFRIGERSIFGPKLIKHKGATANRFILKAFNQTLEAQKRAMYLKLADGIAKLASGGK